MRQLLFTLLVISSATASWADDTVPADNSASNAKKINNSLTAQDQGLSQSDTMITRKIRQSLVADKALSINAKNIKVITLNGHVTLKGPVGSAAELARVEQLARASTSAGITNQLTIAK